jgi:predicted Fe-Mo cluster-binding NifX family protein
MKIAITATGNSNESTIDERFGRCAWFVIYDTESKSTEFIPNRVRDADEDAGFAAVELLKGRKVSKIVSGEFGLKVKPLLDSLKIQMIVLKKTDKTIGEIIEMLEH